MKVERRTVEATGASSLEDVVVSLPMSGSEMFLEVSSVGGIDKSGLGIIGIFAADIGESKLETRTV